MLFLSIILFVFFFFKQKTAYEMRISDWSSDVCSSDLSHISERHRLRRCASGVGARFGKESTRTQIRSPRQPLRHGGRCLRTRHLRALNRGKSKSGNGTFITINGNPGRPLVEFSLQENTPATKNGRAAVRERGFHHMVTPGVAGP